MLLLVKVGYVSQVPKLPPSLIVRQHGVNQHQLLTLIQ